jgi:hypothetical protein
MQKQIAHRTLQILLFLYLSAAIPLAPAQQPPSPMLDEILLQLQHNRDRYSQTVPNFFCTEHVTSSELFGNNTQTTVTDSVFRITRTPSGAFAEEHEVQTVNGTPAKGQNVNGPVILGGVFSGGLDPVSLNQKACMNYTLEPIPATHSDEPYIIRFDTLPNVENESQCVLKEEGSGRVFIDPSTMRVTRMELTAPHHFIAGGEAGVWKISIDYAPVSFTGQLFWMPTAITSTATPTGVPTRTVYSFSARYTGYHKLEVTSRIVAPQ